MSDVVARGAGLPIAQHKAHDIEVRGRKAPLTVYVLPTLEALGA
jgi:hypothetical protein